MDERNYASSVLTLASVRSRLFRRFAQLERAFRNCENPSCEHRRVDWQFWFRKSEGIYLQGQWYCSPECFEQAALTMLIRLLPPSESNKVKKHRIPIGLLLLSRGVINGDQLKHALALQRQKGGGRIGKILQQIHAVSERDITDGLAAQWGCPVYPLGTAREYLHCASLLPLILLDTGRMLPVHYLPLQETLYLAFVEGVDRTTLYAVEQMLRVRTVPCIVSESEQRDALEILRRFEGQSTTVFESPAEPLEMARTARSYALQLDAKEVWMARSGRFIWIRLATSVDYKDILFQSLGNVQ
jgi:hypothetical protein